MIRVRNGASVRRHLEKLRLEAAQRTREALEQAARVALDVARGRAPGKLPATLSARLLNQHAVRVSSSSPVAIFTEAGTKPHPIAPKRARVLRFQVAGSVVFARVVHHPGNKAIHYMRDGAEAGKAELRRLMAQIFR